MKPTQSHLNEAQRIFDRLGRGSVADIDAIAQALAEAERKSMKRAAEIVRERGPATQDITSTMICDALDEAATAILSEAES